MLSAGISVYITQLWFPSQFLMLFQMECSAWLSVLSLQTPSADWWILDDRFFKATSSLTFSFTTVQANQVFSIRYQSGTRYQFEYSFIYQKSDEQTCDPNKSMTRANLSKVFSMVKIRGDFRGAPLITLQPTKHSFSRLSFSGLIAFIREFLFSRQLATGNERNEAHP